MAFNNHSDTLFHFTGKKDGLKSLIGILEDGFKFGYCNDYLDFEKNIFVAFPMVCFCDIPIDDCEEHTSKYGSFGIGISKQYLINNFKGNFGPVNYYLSDASIEAAFSIKDLVAKEQAHKKEIISLHGNILNGEHGMDYLTSGFNVIAYHKKAVASIALMKPYNTGERINYNECEWRMYIPENGSYRGKKDVCRWYWNKEEYEKDKLTGKLYYNGYQLTLPLSAIDMIVVPDNKSAVDAKERIISLNKVMGKESEKTEVNSLLSKVYVIK